MKVKKRNMLGKYNRKQNYVKMYIDHNPKWDDKSIHARESFWIKKVITEENPTCNVFTISA
jgi:hypothetical protein